MYEAPSPHGQWLELAKDMCLTPEGIAGIMRCHEVLKEKLFLTPPESCMKRDGPSHRNRAMTIRHTSLMNVSHLRPVQQQNQGRQRDGPVDIIENSFRA